MERNDAELTLEKYKIGSLQFENCVALENNYLKIFIYYRRNFLIAFVNVAKIRLNLALILAH